MQLAHRVALNGTQLDSLDSRIIIKAIEEGAGKESISAVGAASGDGQRITSRRRDTMDIVVKFSLNIDESEMQSRATLLESINKWDSGGGVLTVNYRTGRQARVVCVQAPGGGDLWEWTNVYSITFRAYGVPYWTETTPTTYTQSSVSSISSGASITVNGSARTPLEFEFKNTSGSTVNTFSITAGDRTISLSDLGLANNSTLTLDHDERGVQRIRVGSTSKLACRSEESDDELWAEPGTVSITMTAGGAGNLTVKSYGRFV